MCVFVCMCVCVCLCVCVCECMCVCPAKIMRSKRQNYALIGG